MEYIIKILTHPRISDAAGLLGDLGNQNAPMAKIGDLGKIIINSLNLMFAIVGGVCLMMILWGVFNLLTSGGDENKAKKAKEILTAAVVGTLITISAASLVRMFVEILGSSIG